MESIWNYLFLWQKSERLRFVKSWELWPSAAFAFPHFSPPLKQDWKAQKILNKTLLSRRKRRTEWLSYDSILLGWMNALERKGQFLEFTFKATPIHPQQTKGLWTYHSSNNAPNTSQRNNNAWLGFSWIETIFFIYHTFSSRSVAANHSKGKDSC